MYQHTANNPLKLTCDDVQALTVTQLNDHFDLVVDGDKFKTDDIFNVVVAASAQAIAIESAANQLESAPSASTVRLCLRKRFIKPATLAEIENSSNAALIAQLPPRIVAKSLAIAIDLTFIPYHGQAASDPDEIRRSQAKGGTTHFHCYATAYVIKSDKRVTLAMTYVKAADTLPEVLQRLLNRLKEVPVEVKRLYLDKEFYNVAVIQFFQEQHSELSVVIPVVIRGKTGGTFALLTGRQGYQTRYTMKSPKHGQATFDITIVRKYSKGRYRRHGVAWFAYAQLGPSQLLSHQIYESYRLRFGIESTYRLMNGARARTSSRCPKLRLFLVGVALCLINIWVFLLWSYLGRPRQGGRLIFKARFRFTMFKQFLLEAVKTIYGAVKSVMLPAGQRC